MSSGIRFSFSIRGISPEVTEQELNEYFAKIGTVISIKHIPPSGRITTASAYVNLGSGNAAAVLALNNTAPEFNKSMVLSVRQQAGHIAKAAAAVNEIKFSISVRGIHGLATETDVRAAFSELGKVHSFKIHNAPAHSRFAYKAAYINFSDGEPAPCLALNGQSPPWNHGSSITVQEQDVNIARAAAAKAMSAHMAQRTDYAAAVPDRALMSKKRQQALSIDDDEEDEDEEEQAAAPAPAATAPAAKKPAVEAQARANQNGGAGHEPAKKGNGPADAGETVKVVRRKEEKGAASAFERKGRLGDRLGGGAEKAGAAFPGGGIAGGGLMSASKRRAMEAEREAREAAQAAINKRKEPETGREEAKGGLMSKSARQKGGDVGGGGGLTLQSKAKRDSAGGTHVGGADGGAGGKRVPAREEGVEVVPKKIKLGGAGADSEGVQKKSEGGAKKPDLPKLATGQKAVVKAKGGTPKAATPKAATPKAMTPKAFTPKGGAEGGAEGDAEVEFEEEEELGEWEEEAEGGGGAEEVVEGEEEEVSLEDLENFANSLA